jgi:hypothetical protein
MKCSCRAGSETQQDLTVILAALEAATATLALPDLPEDARALALHSQRVASAEYDRRRLACEELPNCAFALFLQNASA